MALKFKHQSKDEIPAQLHSLYVEREGAWVLEVEGAAEKTRLDEMRTNNIALSNELKEFKQRFEGIDPAEVRKLADQKRKLEEAAQLKAGEFDKVLDTRLKTVRADFEKQLGAVTGERDTLNARLTAIQIDQAVVTEATKRGLRPTAIPDITARARNTFRLVNGVPQAFEADGQTVRPGRDGMTPLSLAEWLDAQVSDAPHLFEGSAGGGGGGATSQYGNGSGGAGGSRSVKNPFRKETWNLTEQMKLTKSDPHLAARLKAAA